MSQYWSDIVHKLTPYVPGEQPKLDNLVKLNTNENPFAPSATLVKAIAAEVEKTATHLNRYPDRDAITLRTKLAGYINSQSSSCDCSIC